jgi:dynein heavy chain
MFLHPSALNMRGFVGVTQGVDDLELQVLLTGGASLKRLAELKPNPAPDWLADKAWSDLNHLAQSVAGVAEAPAHVCAHPTAWRVWCDAGEPFLAALPAPFDARLSKVQQLLMVRFWVLGFRV